MPNIGQDLFRKAVLGFMDQHGQDTDRQWEEVERTFNELSTALKLYAGQTGGKFVLGVDERYNDPVLTRSPYPISYFLPSSQVVFENPDVKQITDNFWAKASVTWQFRTFEIRFDLHKMWLFLSLGPAPTMPPLTAECSIRPQKAITLLLYKKASIPFSGPTGLADLSVFRTLFPVYEKFLPVRLKALDGKIPTSTFFCPFDHSKLQERFTLRCSSIPVGEVFAGDPILSQLLIDLPGLKSLTVGGISLNQLDDYAATLFANPDPAGEQIPLLHEVMMRSIILLEKSKVIVGTSP